MAKHPTHTTHTHTYTPHTQAPPPPPPPPEVTTYTKSDNGTLWGRYKANGTGNTGTAVIPGGANERRCNTVGLIIQEAAVAANQLLPEGADLTAVLAALDTAMTSLHTGSAKISNP